MPFKDFCLVKMVSLPALISFSPTVSTRARPVTTEDPGFSLLGDGSLDPAPAEAGRASLEALDILKVSAVFPPLGQQGPLRLDECKSVTLKLWRVVTGAGRLQGEVRREGTFGKMGGE